MLSFLSFRPRRNTSAQERRDRAEGEASFLGGKGCTCVALWAPCILVMLLYYSRPVCQVTAPTQLTWSRPTNHRGETYPGQSVYSNRIIALLHLPPKIFPSPSPLRPAVLPPPFSRLMVSLSFALGQQ